jgi:ribosomal protein S11
MGIRLGSERGFSFASLVTVLLIAGILYISYTGLVSVRESAPSDPLEATAVSKDVACKMNRQALEKQLLNWMGRNPGKDASIRSLAASGVNIPRCPDGGKLRIEDGKVECSTHSTP